MGWLLWLLCLLLVVACLLARYVNQLIKKQLRKAGVSLSCGSLSLNSVSSLKVELAKGPLRSITVERVAWRSAAHSGSSAGSGVNSSTGVPAWLPILVSGVHVVLRDASAASGSSKARAKKRKRGQQHPAAAAAARPAVGSILAVARRLLPGVTITVQNVAVELQAHGLALQLRKLLLSWSVESSSPVLGCTVLLQDFAVTPGTTPCDGAAQLANLSCPVAQLSVGLVASRSALPISCTEVCVQIGQLKLTGASQLAVLTAAAAAAAAQAAVPLAATAGGSSLQGTETAEQAGAASSASDSSTNQGKPGKLPAMQLMQVLALLPEKVKVSLVGAQVLPCRAAPAGRESILQLPEVTGSIGAVSLAASCCQQPAAAKLGAKVLSMSLSVGCMQLTAAPGAAGSCSSGGYQGTGGNSGDSNKNIAASVTLPSIAATVSIAKVAEGSSSSGSTPGSPVQPSATGLRLRRPTQENEHQHHQHYHQQHQTAAQQQVLLKVMCSCKLAQQPQVQLQAAWLPRLLKSVQVLQLSFRELKQRRMAVRAAAAAAAAAAREAAQAAAAAAISQQEQLQLPEGLLSPAMSLTSLPRPETPTLVTPSLSPTPGLASPSDDFSPEADADAATASAAAVQSSPLAARSPSSTTRPSAISSFGSGVLQRLPSKLLFTPASSPEQQLGLVAELAVAIEAGIRLEMIDRNEDVLCLLMLEEMEGGGTVSVSPSSSSSMAQQQQQHSQQPDHKAVQMTFAGHASLQQLSVLVAAGRGVVTPAQQAQAGAARIDSGLHQLLSLDKATAHASSTDMAVAEVLAGDAAMTKQQLALHLSNWVGHLKVAASVAVLQTVLHVAEQLYCPSCKAAGGSSQRKGRPATAPAAGGAPSKAQKRSKPKRMLLASADVQLQACTLALSHDLPVCSEFGTAAGTAAAAAGMQAQLLASLSAVRLSVVPLQQQLAASLQQVQLGYHASRPAEAPANVIVPESQSVELLLLQAVEFRRYVGPQMQLLKVGLQQVRSDVHVDVALAGAGLAAATLQQAAACVQQLQLRRASAPAAFAAREAAAAAVAAAAASSPSAAQAAAAVAVDAAAMLDEQGMLRGDSFSALANTAPMQGMSGSFTGGVAQLQPATPSCPARQAPVAPSSSSSSATKVQNKQKPVLALEARVHDVALQLSVCDNDALMVQMDQLKFSSVLEQAVIEQLRFAINDRSIVQVPHAAVHGVPGWLPPGGTAAAAAAAAAATSRAAGWESHQADMPSLRNSSRQASGAEASHVSWTVLPDNISCSPGMHGRTRGAATASLDRSASSGIGYEDVEFLNDPLPSGSLGSRRPPAEGDPALYHRQGARQQAARERCKVQEKAGASSAAAADSSTSKANGSVSRPNSGAAAAAGSAGDAPSTAAAGLIISLDVFAEQVLFSIPYDEAPGRIILVCETWAKAVKEVMKPQLSVIKASVSSLKAGLTALKAAPSSNSAAKAPKAKPPKPAYLELLVNLQQIVFSLEQHPLEKWLGLHGPLLQDMAAERHLTEQLLASCASAHGRISRSGGNSAAAGAVVAAKAGGSLHRMGTSKKRQWQRRAWGTLSKKGAGTVVAGIAAGSVTGAAAAAAAATAAAAGPIMGSLTVATSATEPGLTVIASGTSAAAAGDAPSTLPAGDASDTETAAAGELSGDTSDEIDSSDDDAVELGDPDALAAALPSSASLLAAEAGRQGSGPGVDTSEPSAGAVGGQGPVPVDAVAAAVAGDTTSEMAQAVLEAHRELFVMYKHRCRPLEAAMEDPYHHCQALMHVSCARAEAVVLICLPGNAAADAMATEVIRRVDPPSEGVEMQRTQSISIDFSGHNVAAHFGGVEEMAATIGSIGASGLLVRARQLCAPPQTRPMRMAVGRWHAADVPVVVKGTQPPMKMYTDIKAELEDVQGAFCPGLEAPFGQLNIAFKRLVVPNVLNADGSVPPSRHPGLPWWDMMRYMWRGVASVKVRGLTAVLANTLDPHVRPRDERLALTAATLSISVAAGRIDMTTTNLSAHAHALPPDPSLGDALLLLPAFHLPLVNITFHITTKMPGGRNSLLHHVFPILAAPPKPDSPPQELVDVFGLMKCEGWSLGIDIAVNSDKSFAHGRGTAAAGSAGGGGLSTAGAAGVPLGGPAGAAGSCWHYFQPFNLPHAFIGEFQIKYIIEMVDVLVNPSPVVRLSRKLKPFYVRDRRPEAIAAAREVATVRASILQMPLLKQRVEINLTADVFRVHHDAQDAEDPSDMVYIALSSVRYSNTFTYSRLKRTLQLSNGPRLKDSMRQFMASLSVEAFDLKVVKPQADEQLSTMLNNAQWGLTAVCQTPVTAGPPGLGLQTGLLGSAGAPHACATPTASGSGGNRRVTGAQEQLSRAAAEPRTPPRHHVAAAAAASAPPPSSPRSTAAPRSPLVHSRTGASSGRRGDAGAPGRNGEDDGNDVPGFGQGLIAAAACFLLRQAPEDAATAAAAAGAASAAAVGSIPIDPPPVPKRPIRMIAQDVKLLCPAELRDTCMLLFHHMQKAFSGINFGQPRGPARISTKKQQQQQAGEGGGGSSGSNSPRILRSRSDASDASASLSRSSTGVAPGLGSSSLRRHGSSDMGPAAAAALGGDSSTGAAGASSSSNSMVMTAHDEELMLQRILMENAAAAAAAEKKRAAARAKDIQQQQQRLDPLSSGSTAVGAGGTAPGSSAGEAHAEGDQEGLGQAAGAVRALKCSTSGGSSAGPGAIAAGLDEDMHRESPRSVALSELSHATDSSATGAGSQQQQQQQAGASAGGSSSLEQLLLEYEIEFVQVQVNLVSDSARGSLVLGTNSALLLGHLNPARLERSVSFKMDQVQAHVVCSEMDPQRGPLWLQIANGKLSTPPGAEAIMRQVLLPFKCQLVTTKQAQNSATAAALGAASAAPAGSSSAGIASSSQLQLQLPPQQQQQQQGFGPRGSSSGGAQGNQGAAGAAAQELKLHVPSIVARLDSRQFEVLMDVIQNIAMAPIPTFPPSVRGMAQHPDGASEDDDNQDVQYALETLQSLRERQRCLEQELLAVLAAQQQHAAWQQSQFCQQNLQAFQQQQLAGVAKSAAGGLLAPQQQHTMTTYAASSAGADDGVAPPPSVSIYGDSDYSSNYKGSSWSFSAPSAVAGSGAWTADGRAARQAAYADIKEASIDLVLALMAAGAAAEQLAWQPQQQATGPSKAGNIYTSSSTGSLAMLPGAAAGAAAASRGLASATPASSCSNLTILQQQDQLVLVAERSTVIWWAQEQLQGALDAITASRTVLELLRNEAGLLKVRQRNAMGVDITVDTIDWALSKGNTVIVQGGLKGISYQSIRSEDHTGTTKIQLHTATFRDPQQAAQAQAAAAATAAASSRSMHTSNTSPPEVTTAATDGSSHSASGATAAGSTLPPLVHCTTPRELSVVSSSAASQQQQLAAAAAEAGIILAPWNPDESWEADELVRIYAIHGAMEARHVVYEHIEVLVHPIRVHLTAALAAALQDYFNLREDEASKDKDGKQPPAKPGDAAAARTAKQIARDESKRRNTAPGDLVIGGTGSSTAAPGAPGTAGPTGPASARRPSIFLRRAAAAASVTAATSPSGTAAGQQQPLIAVPANEFEVGSIHSLDGNRSVASTPHVESPGLDGYGGMLPAPVLAHAGAYHVPSAHEAAGGSPVAAAVGDESSVAGGLAAATAGAGAAHQGHLPGKIGSISAAAAAAGLGLAATADAGWLPVLTLSGAAVAWCAVSPIEALGMRYGTVVRSRAGRVGAPTPNPVAVAGPMVVVGSYIPSASGMAVGPGALAGPGVGTGGSMSSVTAAGGAAGMPGIAATGAVMPMTPGAAPPPGPQAATAGAGANGSGSSNRPARAAAPVRSIKFKHVRFNRMHARLTYESPALSIRNFGLVLDNRVYRNIDGGWKSVLNRYKWDVVRSLLKSVTGLQARKLQELQIPTYGSEPPDTLELRSSAGFKAGLMSLLKGRKGLGTRVRLTNAGDGSVSLSDELEGLPGSAADLGTAGEDGGPAGSGAGELGSGGSATAAGADYMELMRSALRVKHKQRKMQLLLGNVPPLPQQAGVTVGLV